MRILPFYGFMSILLIGSAANAAFDFVRGYDTSPEQFSVSLPALNEPFMDNAYGILLTKISSPSQVTDSAAPAWIRHEYSRRPAFNSDGTKAILYSSGGWFRLYSVNKLSNTMAFIRTLPIGGSVEPNWHATNPDIIYYFNNYGAGMKINEYNAATNATRVYRDFSAQVTARFPSAYRAWTKEEGRPSNDGRIWCMQVESSTYAPIGIISYNIETNQVLGAMATADRPDHISTSPSGNFCVPSWAYNRALGTRAYTLDFSKNVQLHTMSEHSDLATSASGKDTYVFFDYDSGDLAMSEFGLDGQGQLVSARTNLFRIYGPNSSATSGHISGVAKNRPGYALISFYSCSENYGSAPCSSLQWFKNKVIAINLKSNFNPDVDIMNVSHTRYGNSGYWGETQAVVNFDFSKALFVSSWGSASESDIASYMIDIPVAALGGQVPTPTTTTLATPPPTTTTQPPVTTTTVPVTTTTHPPTTTTQVPVTTTTMPVTTTTLAPPQATLSVQLVSLSRTSYSAKMVVSTNLPGACRIATEPGYRYEVLYDNFVASSSGLRHKHNNVSIGVKSAAVRYVVCKSGSLQKELKVNIPAAR